MTQSLSSESMNPGGRLPPTLTPTGRFSGKPTLPISRSITLIGARRHARLQLISSTVSQNHALIINADSGPYIRDLASREKVYVNGIEVREGPIADGDEITIGHFTFRFGESPHTQPVESVRNIPAAPPARLDVEGGEMPIPIDGKTLLIGRRNTCDIPLLEASASLTHAIIFEMDGRRYIRDLVSRTGTFVNGRQAHQVELAPGDEIRIGETSMRYLAEGVVGDEVFAPQTTPADLGANIDDLVRLDEPETPAAPPVRPPRPPAPAGSDELELVHDQPAETEPTEMAPEELEAPLEIDVDLDAESAEPPVTEDDLLDQLEPMSVEPEMLELDADVEAPAPQSSAAENIQPQAESHAVSHPPAEFQTEPFDPLPPAELRGPADDQIDLESDDDLSGPGETSTLPAEVESPPAPPPVLSSRVVEPDDEDIAIDLAEAKLTQPLPNADESAADMDPPADASEAIDDVLGLAPNATAPNTTTPESAAPVPPPAMEIAIRDDAFALPEEPEAGRFSEGLEPELAPLDADALHFDAPSADKIETELGLSRELPPVLETPLTQIEAPDPTKPRKKAAPRKRKKKEEPVQTPESLPVEISAEPPAEAAAEVIALTEATPESALPLEQIADVPIQSSAVPEPETVELTDSTFGRAVEEFAGDSAGPIIESPAAPDVVESMAVEPPDAPAEVVESTDAFPAEDDTAIPLLPDDTTAPPADAPTKLFNLQPLPVPDPSPAFEAVEVEQTATDDKTGDAADVMESVAMPTADSKVVHEPPPIFESDAKDDAPGDLNLDLRVEEPIDLPPPKVSSRYAPGASQLHLEPIAESTQSDLEATHEPKEELSPSPVSAVQPEPIEESLEQTKPEPAAEPPATIKSPSAAEQIVEPAVDPGPVAEPIKAPPAAPRLNRPQPVGPSDWGANQEHFLGGMPLKLGGGKPPPPPIAPPVASPVPAEARSNPVETDFVIEEIPRAKPAATNRPAPRQPGGARGPVMPPRPIKRKPAAEAPPFAGDARIGPKTATGFEGLVSPSGGEGDVFAQNPGSLTDGFDPRLVDDVFGGRSARTIPPPQPHDMTQASSPIGSPSGKRSSARRTAQTETPGHSLTPADVPTEVDAGEAVASYQPGALPVIPAALPRKKKRRWFGLKSLVFALPLSLLLALLAIYFFVPLKSAVTGQLTFANVDKLTQQARQELWRRQQKKLTDEAVHLAARRQLSGTHPQLSGGFLDDPISYARTTSAAVMNVDTGVLSLTYVGAGSSADQARMLAMVRGLYENNRDLVDEANELNSTLESNIRERKEAEKALEEKRQQIENLKQITDNAPTASDKTKLEAEAGQLEAAWNAAVATVAKLASELKQMRNNPGAIAAPAATPAAATQPQDAELEKLQAELKGLNEQIVAVQNGRSEKVKSASQKIDAALESLNKQIEQAQAAVKTNPELLAYLTNGQKQLTATRDVTDQLLKRQQEQFDRLSGVKAQLTEKMLAQKSEAWKKDPELVKLMDQKDMLTRQYNAAVGQSMTTEADELKSRLGLLESMIRAKETKVGDDGFYADAINQLQNLIDATQKGMEEDRGRTTAALDEMQAWFARSQPASETLTPEQKQVASEMERRLDELGVARKQYADASEDAVRQADEEIRTLQENASSLTSTVQQRKSELAKSAPPAAAPLKPDEQKNLITQKEAEFSAAEKTRDAAQSAYFAANKKLLEMRQRTEDARAAGEKRDALIRQRDTEVKSLDQLKNDYDLKKKLADQKAYPIAPTENDVKSDNRQDPRPLYVLMAAGAIVALFTCLFLLSGIGSGSESDRASAYPPEGSEPDYAPDAADQESERANPIEV